MLDTLSHRARCTKAIAVIYTDDRSTADALPAVIDAAADKADVAVLDHLLVTDGRWPPQGTPLHHASRAAAASVYAGLRVLPGRDRLAAIFAPVPGRPELAAELQHHADVQLEAIIGSSSERYHRSAIRALHAAHRAAQVGQLPTDAQVARFGVALQSYTVRDAIWLAVDDDRLPGIEVWADLARRLPAPYRAAPLFLAAWRSYRDGNGALANIATDLALAADPGYTAATLLQAALTQGIDPNVLPRLSSPECQPERGAATT